jgi:hypothetical protein
MSKFEFRNRVLEISIADGRFAIETDSKNGKLMQKLSVEAVEVVKKYQADELTEDAVIETFKGYINEVLGDQKAFEKIFASRVPDVRDCMDVLTYIANEITAFVQQPTLAPNRAQRRAVKTPLN